MNWMPLRGMFSDWGIVPGRDFSILRAEIGCEIDFLVWSLWHKQGADRVEIQNNF